MGTPSFVRAIILSFLAASLFGCTEGKRKDSEASIYDQGIKRCRTLAASLDGLDVDLSGNASTLNDKDAQLSESMKTSATLSQIQPLLEDYVLTADRLLKLGDTTVVVFPERESLVASRARAVKYLGQVYAQRSWATKEFGAASSPDVDKAEYTTRSTRFLKNMSEIGRYDFNFHERELGGAFAAIAKKMKIVELQTVYAQAVAVGIDSLRISDLLDRNGNWQDKLLGVIQAKNGYMGIGVLVFTVQQAVQNELKSRGEQVPEQ